MSVRVLSWALEQSTGDPLSKLVLVTIAARGGGSDDWHVWCGSAGDLADRCEVTADEAEAALNHLSALGYIRPVPGGWLVMSPPPLPTPPRDPKRARVFARDGYRCRHCGSGDDLTIDHIYPRSLGGGDEESNLQTLCRRCNSRKGAKVGSEGHSSPPPRDVPRCTRPGHVGQPADRCVACRSELLGEH